jgi:hypothetical protein
MDEAIRALQRQVEAGGERFPGLSHILLVCEESGPSSKESIFERVLGLKIPRPAAGTRIVTTWPAEIGNEAERLLCQVWQHGSAWQKSTGTHWAHFVFRGWAESWAKDKAIDALSNVANLIGRFIRAEKPTDWPDSTERALLALHQYGPVDVYACQELDRPVLAIPTIPLVNQFLTNAEFHYFGVVRDVWTGLSLLCARLLERPTEDRKPDMPGNAFLSPAELAKYFDVNADALRKRLGRVREKDHASFIEVADRAGRDPGFLYQLDSVRPVIESMKKADV